MYHLQCHDDINICAVLCLLCTFLFTWLGTFAHILVRIVAGLSRLCDCGKSPTAFGSGRDVLGRGLWRWLWSSTLTWGTKDFSWFLEFLTLKILLYHVVPYFDPYPNDVGTMVFGLMLKKGALGKLPGRSKKLMSRLVKARKTILEYAMSTAVQDLGVS